MRRAAVSLATHCPARGHRLKPALWAPLCGGFASLDPVATLKELAPAGRAAKKQDTPGRGRLWFQGKRFVSPNTAKTHAVSIYRKLGAASRRQAVGRARELGLLEG